MPLLPKNENKDSFLPNPKENYSISEAYSSVYKAVIEASTINSENIKNTNQEIPFYFSIGYASSLINKSLSCIADAVKAIEELKQIQIQIASSKAKDLKNKIPEFNSKFNKKVDELIDIRNRTCFDIKLFSKEKQNFSLVLNGKITKKLNFSLPSAGRLMEEGEKLKSAESLSNINFEIIDKEIANFSDALLKEHENIKKAKEAVSKEQIDLTIANIDEAKEIIENLKDTMINKPKLINLNQSNISKNTLMNIRKL